MVWRTAFPILSYPVEKHTSRILVSVWNYFGLLREAGQSCGSRHTYIRDVTHAIYTMVG